MSKIDLLEKIKNQTKKMHEADYHISASQPYSKEHLFLNEIFFNPNTKPAWFALSHLGLDYDKHSIMECEEVHEISASEDMQKFRFAQNPKRSNIKSSVVVDGKDLREKPIFIVKDRNENGTTAKYCYIQDGNTLVDIGKELDFANYLVAEFWKNSNWSEANAIAIGVHLNLLEKPFGVAQEDDIRNGLVAISKTDEFVKLMKDVDKNSSLLSEMFSNYYFKMSKKTELIASVTNMINDIIFEKNAQKKQNLNPTIASITKVLQSLGFKDNHNVHYSVQSADAERLVTRHLKFKLSTVPFPSTKVGTVIYSSGSATHDQYWWIKASYNIITKVEEYLELHEGSDAIKRFFIAGIYQNHEGTSQKFELGSIVPIESVKSWYKELKDNDII